MCLKWAALFVRPRGEGGWGFALEQRESSTSRVGRSCTREDGGSTEALPLPGEVRRWSSMAARGWADAVRQA